jgi:PAS domain S-box-containing protein
MALFGNPRRRAIALFGAGVALLLGLLGALQAFNTSNIRFLNPETSGETLAFTGLTVLIFILLMVLLMLLLRNILKLIAEQSSGALGARLRTRMVLGAALIALIPAVFMFLFSFQLMNRSLDRWFSPNASEMRENSIRVVTELVQYVASNARSEAEAIASSGALEGDPARLNSVFADHRITLEGGFIVIFDQNRAVTANYQAPSPTTPARLRSWLDAGEHALPIILSGPLHQILLPAAQRSDAPVLEVNGQDFALGMSSAAGGKVVIAALPMPQGLSKTTERIRDSAAEYWQLFRERNRLRTTFFLLLLLITVFIFFSSVWLAVFLSKQITRPVEALADAMDAIGDGKYERRIETLATGEMGDLVRSFNHMAADLETSRKLAESSSAKLTEANQAIEERRRELETILDTIPSGVVTLNSMGMVLLANHAFTLLLGQGDANLATGKPIEDFFPAECASDLAGVIRRSHRMGSAFTELEFNAHGRTIHLAITSARLKLSPRQTGSVLVVEDTTELLRAQRQLAWKEVAQRVAHEIKNPLTPIALSAERIRRHLDKPQSESPKIIRKCSEVILGCVETLRTLVDQFSALAQFPAPQPRECDVNKVIDQSLALFNGRLDDITLECILEPNLPAVMADPDALRRALANLIDNAAEAMQGSLLRVLTVRSSLGEDATSVEVAVTDTGHGLTEEIRERLFLPFYSTKNRGTGLGLSIAAKIVQEHGGTIRAESNIPKGARFLVRLPLIDGGAHDSSPTHEA